MTPTDTTHSFIINLEKDCHWGREILQRCTLARTFPSHVCWMQHDFNKTSFFFLWVSCDLLCYKPGSCVQQSHLLFWTVLLPATMCKVNLLPRIRGRNDSDSGSCAKHLPICCGSDFKALAAGLISVTETDLFLSIWHSQHSTNHSCRRVSVTTLLVQVSPS